MSHISKNKLNKKTEDTIKNTFNTVLSNIKNEQDANNFINSLLSPTESLMLAKRLAIVLMLSEDIPASRIASALHVTRETVARLELLYQLKPEGYKIALSKINNQKRIKELKSLLIKLANYTGRAAGGYVKPEVL